MLPGTHMVTFQGSSPWLFGAQLFFPVIKNVRQDTEATTQNDTEFIVKQI